MHLYLKLANNNHIGITDVLLTETLLVTTENPGPLPLWPHIRQIRAEYLGPVESGTTTPAYAILPCTLL